MVTKDFILKNLDELPENRLHEVLDFILFLRYRQTEEELEDAEDIAGAKKSLAEPDFITLTEMKQELGLR
ncbi:MAG: DUF2281 domain-containing protein [Alkalinema sp. CAN_BIN05]|nr:DUF2281 domain-containing protein [Alkalinema sp. CAN_BIN05]